MIAIPVYVTNKDTYELLSKCLKSAPEQPMLFINEWGVNVDIPSKSSMQMHENSVAGAWNKSIEYAYENLDGVCIIANQDIEFPDNIDILKEAALSHGIACARTPEGYPDFSLFAVNPRWIFDTFGTLRPFDENFKGAYIEDTDFVRQCEVKGIKINTVQLDFNHYGSSVVKHCPEMQDGTGLHKNFRENHVYYINKWGGVRGYERFKTPFNK